MEEAKNLTDRLIAHRSEGTSRATSTPSSRILRAASVAWSRISRPGAVIEPMKERWRWLTEPMRPGMASPPPPRSHAIRISRRVNAEPTCLRIDPLKGSILNPFLSRLFRFPSAFLVASTLLNTSVKQAVLLSKEES